MSDTTLADALHELRMVKAQRDRERQRADVERRRAEAAEANARTAWQMAGWRAPVRRDDPDHG